MKFKRNSNDVFGKEQIAIMGCIVNGPGEMADADFGYVGGAPGKIDLYVGKVIRLVKLMLAYKKRCTKTKKKSID